LLPSSVTVNGLQSVEWDRTRYLVGKSGSTDDASFLAFATQMCRRSSPTSALVTCWSYEDDWQASRL